jgi:hypothetical protein
MQPRMPQPSLQPPRQVPLREAEYTPMESSSRRRYPLVPTLAVRVGYPTETRLLHWNVHGASESKGEGMEVISNP